MKITSSKIPEVLLLTPQVFADKRGFFLETYHSLRFSENQIPLTFVQDNHSRSIKNVLRGLHYQIKNPQAKLVSVIRGAIFDVAVDIRRGSPTFGHYVSALLTEDNPQQMYVPQGFAHGFCAVSDEADVIYKCTDYYNPAHERGIIWNDPSLNIAWPAVTPLLSEKDQQYPKLCEVKENDLPLYNENIYVST